jgi:ADP-ribose pyrophosphatase YjhB (NUDIX family)
MPTDKIKGRTVGIVLDRPEDRKVLLIETDRHNSFTWEIPGGDVEPNETINWAAARLLKKGTGLVAELKFVRYHQWATTNHPEHLWEHYMFTGVYDGRSVIRLESPMAEYHWSTINEALHLSAERWTKHYLYSIHP